MVFSLDLITGLLSFLFTLMVLSYLIGDNPLFKIAVYLFVGVSSGYAIAIIFWQVLFAKLLLPTITVLQTGAYDVGMIRLVVPWLGLFFILMKASPRFAGASRMVMAFLVGAGAAVTLVGTLTGTLLPQIAATINAFDLDVAQARNIKVSEVLGSGAVILIGVVTSLAYFHFGARRQQDGTIHRLGFIEVAAWVGQFFIGIALGVIFSGVFASALTTLLERAFSIVQFINTLIGVP
ncbi:MAG: hypothetical protein H6635_16255 [Anaerolineales bacterium]|nr:hypothetical protein [Anaerolineales bacterium]MCB9146913.1 hypothetical protein [Anaerolineales bacterium]